MRSASLGRAPGGNSRVELRSLTTTASFERLAVTGGAAGESAIVDAAVPAFQDRLGHDQSRPQTIDIVERESLPCLPLRPRFPERDERWFEYIRQIQPVQQAAARLVGKFADRTASEQGIETGRRLKPDMGDLPAGPALPHRQPNGSMPFGVAKFSDESVHRDNIGETRIVRIADRARRTVLVAIQQIAEQRPRLREAPRHPIRPPVS